MLYPDMSRSTYDKSDHFVFAAPCTKHEWYELHGQILSQWAQRTKKTPNSRGATEDYLGWIELEDDSLEKVCVILRTPEATDTMCEETAAWIRVSQEFTGMIYALKYDPGYGFGNGESLSQIVCRTAGVPPSQVRHVITTKRNNV